MHGTFYHPYNRMHFNDSYLGRHTHAKTIPLLHLEVDQVSFDGSPVQRRCFKFIENGKVDRLHAKPTRVKNKKILTAQWIYFSNISKLSSNLMFVSSFLFLLLTLIFKNVPIEIQQDRKQWSPSILHQVLEQLIRDTPRDILAKELWMAAGNSETWWRVTQRSVTSSVFFSLQ